MEGWEVHLGNANFEFDARKLPSPSDSRVRDVFPNVDRLLVSARLAEWGIDAGDIPIRAGDSNVARLAAVPQGVIYFHRPSLEFGPGGEIPDERFDYLLLAHELEHMLQFVEDRVDWSGAYGWGTLHEWASLPHERDAARQEAREAVRMGMPRGEFLAFQARVFPSIRRAITGITYPAYARARDVHVSQHRRGAH